jgi:hypothetical protein
MKILEVWPYRRRRRRNRKREIEKRGKLKKETYGFNGKTETGWQ